MLNAKDYSSLNKSNSHYAVRNIICEHILLKKLLFQEVLQYFFYLE